jgi:hypothetical protein
MEKVWKIKNEKDHPVKISVALSSTKAPGIILQPGQFCLSIAQITAPLDKQCKTGFVSIDKEYVNSQNLELGKAYDLTTLDKIQEKTKIYAK